MARRMTVNQLHKALGKMIENGNGRLPVCVNKPTFSSNLEPDGHVILDICGANMRVYPVIDGDGGTALRKDGTERQMSCVVLYGSSGDSES